jgi:hypothetical protein
MRKYQWILIFLSHRIWWSTPRKKTSKVKHIPELVLAAVDSNISSLPLDAVDTESNVGGPLGYNEAKTITESSTGLPSHLIAMESNVGGIPAAESCVIAAPDSSTALPSDGVDTESNLGGIPAAESTVVAAWDLEKSCNIFVHGDNKGSASSLDPPQTSHLDIVDMSQHVCCGYSYICHLVDPVSRRGHVTLLRSTSNEELVNTFIKLMEFLDSLQQCYVMILILIAGRKSFAITGH